MVLGKEVLSDIAPAHAEAPALDLGGLGGVDREAAGGVQNGLVPHCVAPHEPAQTSMVHTVMMWGLPSAGAASFY